MGRNWYAENKEHHKATVRANTKKAIQSAREFVYEYLRTHPCERCGETDPTVLEFHHVGEKDREVGRMLTQGYSVDAIAAEIAMCQVLCANCHRRLTAKEQGWSKGRER